MPPGCRLLIGLLVSMVQNTDTEVDNEGVETVDTYGIDVPWYVMVVSALRAIVRR